MQTNAEVTPVTQANAEIAPAAPIAPKKERVHFVDNAKFMLIFLVVLAHGISPLKKHHDSVYAIWYTINAFHMPCFIFLSGFFAKKYIVKKQFNIQKPFYYFMLYFFCQISVWCFEYFVLKDHTISKSFVAARSSLWYLQCLIIWHVMLPFLERIKPKYMIPLSFVIAIIMGYDSNLPGAFSSSRVLVHLPFFLLGYYCSMDMLKKLVDGWWKKVVAVLAFVALFVVVLYHRGVIPERIIVASYQYKNVTSNFYSFEMMWFARILFYITAIVLSIGFLVLTPKKQTFFTKLGSRTLQVYILHRFLYLAELEYNWASYFDSKIGFLVLLVILTAIVFILSMKVFEYPFIWISKIKIKPLLKDEYKEGQ